jgi:hypothetical protein
MGLGAVRGAAALWHGAAAARNVTRNTARLARFIIDVLYMRIDRNLVFIMTE